MSFSPHYFGKYYLFEKIAIGGMAEIFKAKLFGIEGFERVVVVKQILPEYAGEEEFVNMFIDEARILVSLNHANIVPVYDLGSIDGRYYIAMEWVDGENMETIIERWSKTVNAPVPEPYALFVSFEIAKGLDYAHRKRGRDGLLQNIVHRDVSPQNIMVSFTGEVKLVDFGIAKAASKFHSTRAGTLKGKFSYMSPEQAHGEPVDGRSDVYALGIVMWEMLTGRRLFDAEKDIDLLNMVRYPLVVSPREYNPVISVETECIVLKALAKERAGRYQSAYEMQMELSSVLHNPEEKASAATVAEWMQDLFGAERSGRLAPMAPPRPPQIVREVSFARSDALEAAIAVTSSYSAPVVELTDPVSDDGETNVSSVPEGALPHSTPGAVRLAEGGNTPRQYRIPERKTNTYSVTQEGSGTSVSERDETQVTSRTGVDGANAHSASNTILWFLFTFLFLEMVLAAGLLWTPLPKYAQEAVRRLPAFEQQVMNALRGRSPRKAPPQTAPRARPTPSKAPTGK